MNLHNAIMNIPCKTTEHAYGAYERGHHDARHAAAELAAEFVAASPSWHDRPTGPGDWSDTSCVYRISEASLKLMQARGDGWWRLGRVFGPIPAGEGVAK